MTNSIFGRLLITSLLLLAMLYGWLDHAINALYEQRVLVGKEAQLKLQNMVLLSAASIEDDKLTMPEELRESRFDLFESGLYGYIVDSESKILWQSWSTDNFRPQQSLLSSPDLATGSGRFEQSEAFFIHRYRVLWEIIDEKPQQLTFVVIEDAALTRADIAHFRTQLRTGLASSALLFITSLLLILRWGTAPLRGLALALKRMERGESQQLEGRYPVELQPLARNLDDLLKAERQQRERYRTTLADLAHSLKTPLAVVRNLVESAPAVDQNAGAIDEQLQRMDDIISYQLQRAVLAAPHRLSESHSVLKAARRLQTALQKVYADKQVSLSLEVDDDALFRGEEHDLMEVLGNLLENAWKACKSQVQLQALVDAEGLVLKFHDDGSGIPEALREQAMQRGKRLDCSQPGHGIGLDIVRDIIDSYRGRMQIGESPLGGALITVRLPL